MKSELRRIPPAPRRVRLRPLLAHRWPLFGIGGPMVAIGSLIAWLMFLQSGGKFSLGPRLAAGPSEVVGGTAEEVRPPVEFDGRAWQDVRYSFQWHGMQLYNGCFVPSGSVEVGSDVRVRVLIDDPNISCIEDGTLHHDRDWLRAQFWLVLLTVPGSLVLLAWLAGVFQLRQVLVHGDASVASVLAVRRVPFLVPEMLSVHYEFRDHRAELRRNRHWVRAHGELGARLRQQLVREPFAEMPVLHDRRLPQWNRLMLPGDFLREPPPAPSPHDLGTTL
jgi:hypothetical protein